VVAVQRHSLAPLTWPRTTNNLIVQFIFLFSVSSFSVSILVPQNTKLCFTFAVIRLHTFKICAVCRHYFICKTIIFFNVIIVFLSHIFLPNAVVEWLAFRLRIREVPDSNMALQTEDVSGFPQSFQPNETIVA
jgi:hypothetical protein